MPRPLKVWWNDVRSTGARTTVSRWGFLRCLGVIYLIAFVSLWTQLIGLIGHDGILPAGQLLQAARVHLGPQRYWLLPTLCWLTTSDTFLHGLCAAGVGLSLALIGDVAPVFVLALLWTIYLSLATVGQDFLSFQWDNLLLETGFLAMFLCPFRLRAGSRADPPPSSAAVWLLRWLLVRLMLSSGFVKLASGDPSWRSLTALTYHYETQPLPPWTAWYLQQLPVWCHRGTCFVLFIIELVVPWFIFGSRRSRRIACGVLVGFQVLILATGNYGFFNWLTIALCVLLLEDDAWPKRWRPRFLNAVEPVQAKRWPSWLLIPLAMVIVGVSVEQVIERPQRGVRPMAPLTVVARWIAPLRTINAYGLFAVMTTSRPEIILEGSRDGITWLSYEFRYTPGGLTRRPTFVAPHQPRLDWQMWFAALGRYQDQPWFLALCERLLQGSPSVLALFAHNPFPGAPPRYLRAVVYEYRFTDGPTRRARGTWWRRDVKGLYCPVLSLR